MSHQPGFLASASTTGFNIIGHLGASAGLGVVARSMARVLLERGYAISVLDVDYGLKRADLAMPGLVNIVARVQDLPHRVNLICVSIQHLPALLWRHHPELLDARFFNAAIVFWELSTLPRVWKHALGLCDALIACSPFVQRVLQQQLPTIPALYAEHPLFLPAVSSASREHLGIPASAIVFGASFDLGGDPARKNPAAIVRAFRRAFPGNEDVRLLIKGNGALRQSSSHPIFSEIREAIQSDPRIFFIAATLPYEEVLGLYAACDVYVSLHRAEGLGLGPMEAMALGKPVIATGYSGNMSYMTAVNSFPIRYTLVPTSHCFWQYSRAYAGLGAYWAEADVDHAAQVMRRLAADPELRNRIGKLARREIEARQKLARKAEFADELIILADKARGPAKRIAPRWRLMIEDIAHPMHIRLRLRRIFVN